LQTETCQSQRAVGHLAAREDPTVSKETTMDFRVTAAIVFWRPFVVMAFERRPELMSEGLVTTRKCFDKWTGPGLAGFASLDGLIQNLLHPAKIANAGSHIGEMFDGNPLRVAT
jgi:hypothetical protein